MHASPMLFTTISSRKSLKIDDGGGDCIRFEPMLVIARYDCRRSRWRCIEGGSIVNLHRILAFLEPEEIRMSNNPMSVGKTTTARLDDHNEHKYRALVDLTSEGRKTSMKCAHHVQEVATEGQARIWLGRTANCIHGYYTRI